MRQGFRASVAGLVLCVLAACLAACSEPPAQIPVQEMAEEASVPRLTAGTEGTEVEVAGTWSTDGLDVTYLVFPACISSWAAARSTAIRMRPTTGTAYIINTIGRRIGSRSSKWRPWKKRPLRDRCAFGGGGLPAAWAFTIFRPAASE